LTDDDRRAITAAMQRLFAGTPLRSSGKLDIVSLAQEAGVKRNKLTRKHTDLKDLFYTQRRTRDGVPDNEVKLREQIAALQKTNQSLRDERDRCRLDQRNVRSRVARADHRERQPLPRLTQPTVRPAVSG